MKEELLSSNERRIAYQEIYCLAQMSLLSLNRSNKIINIVYLFIILLLIGVESLVLS